MSRSKLNKHNFPRNILSDPATHFLLGHFLYCCVVSKNHALSFGILGNWKLYIHPITHQITSSMKTGLVVVVQSPSRVQLFVTPWTAAHQASLSPFFSCPLSFQASGSFPVSQLFTSDGQCIGVSASVLLTQSLFPGNSSWYK